MSGEKTEKAAVTKRSKSSSHVASNENSSSSSGDSSGIRISITRPSAHGREYLVVTSVWALALRRDASPEPEVHLFESALDREDIVITKGIVLQELLQGFQGPKSKDEIVRSFCLLPDITPDLDDHIEAAGLRNTCGRQGIQVGTIDALIAQWSIRHGL